MSNTTFTELGASIAKRMGDLDDLMELARASILTTAAEFAETAEPFIGKREAATFLNMSVSTLERRMSQKRRPPYYHDGGKVTFRRSELKRWREQWRVGG